MAQYLNSAEPMADGSDSTVLLADDFGDGTWYVTDAEHPVTPPQGKNYGPNDGWHGTIFADDDGGNGHCRSAGFPNGNGGFAATSGDRVGAMYEAWHWFGPSETEYNEIYHRFYTKFLSGYIFGHEKLVFYQWDETTLGQVCILMTPFGSAEFDMQTQPPDDSRYPQNQGVNLEFTPDHWYYVEVHVKLDTPAGNSTGVLEVWADDCGTDGLTTPGNGGLGTLRLRYTGLNIRPSDARSLGVIWQENWSNAAGGPGSTAEGEVYNTNVIVRTQRVGPMTISSGSTLPIFGQILL